MASARPRPTCAVEPEISRGRLRRFHRANSAVADDGRPSAHLTSTVHCWRRACWYVVRMRLVEGAHQAAMLFSESYGWRSTRDLTMHSRSDIYSFTVGGGKRPARCVVSVSGNETAASVGGGLSGAAPMAVRSRHLLHETTLPAIRPRVPPRDSTKFSPAPGHLGASMAAARSVHAQLLPAVDRASPGP